MFALGGGFSGEVVITAWTDQDRDATLRRIVGVTVARYFKEFPG